MYQKERKYGCVQIAREEDKMIILSYSGVFAALSGGNK